jgi:phage protein D
MRMADINQVLMISFSLSINGKELSQDRRECIQSITIEETVDGADTMTLAIHDPDFLYINDNIFIEDVKVYAKINWVGSTHVEEFNGYISAIDISFPEEGEPNLSILCMDNTHVMNRKKKKRSWKNTTRAEVVKIIAKEYGFKCVVQSGYTFEKEETITQSDATDIEFCESMAGEEVYPFECNLKGDTLYYIKRGLLSKSKMDLGYKVYPYNMTSFTPRINKETRQEEIKSSSIDGASKKVTSSSSTPKNTKADTQGDSVKGESKQQGMTYTKGNWSPTP